MREIRKYGYVCVEKDSLRRGMRLHDDKNKRREKKRTIYGLNENKDKYDDNNRIKIRLKKKCIKIAREKKY